MTKQKRTRENPAAERPVPTRERTKAQAVQGEAPKRGMPTEEEPLRAYREAIRAELQED
jgi:hypothetical protein